jgi:hypothetical protein
VIGVDVPNSRAYTDASEQLAISAGLRVLTREIVPPTTTDFASFATRIAESDATWAWANGPWGAQIGVFDSLQRLGWPGTYLVYGLAPAEEELRRRQASNLLALTATAMFAEQLPIHQEIRAAAAQYGTTYPVEQLGEGWVTAMVLHEVVRSSSETHDAGHVLSALNQLDLDTQGLRGSRITFTRDNHFRTQGSYKVYRWDSQTEQIAVVSDWEVVDVVPRGN